MLRHQSHFTSDNDSLQTDVMRFMAIIAFCLMAILAVVRNVEPVPSPVVSGQNPVIEDAIPDAIQMDRSVEPERFTQRVASSFTQPPIRAESLVRLPTSDESFLDELMQTVQEEQSQREVQDIVQSEPGPDIEQAPKTEPGLSLRFATDRDFLRLVTKGEIHVYAYKARTVLGLDRNFDFLSADPPGRVYELLPQTIPGLISAALNRATPQADTYTWGIRMPRKLEGKIRRFIDRGVHGELVIDRYGEVHHVPS
ncbi:MAG: hypothetical protein O7B25_11655 [Gammaproteobacteria bacterium]|nr:hypothetical protein [Gammaproteobacteria bacterium]